MFHERMKTCIFISFYSNNAECVKHMLYSVLGAVYLIYHLIFQQSIEWSDFNLQHDGGELLQVGLGLFLLQVG